MPQSITLWNHVWIMSDSSLLHHLANACVLHYTIGHEALLVHLLASRPNMSDNGATILHKIFQNINVKVCTLI